MVNLASFETVLQRLLATAARTYGMAAIEPQLARSLRLLESDAGARPAMAERLIELMSSDAEYLRLGRPGVMELLEYTMHKLRWPEIRAALVNIDVPRSDPRERQAAKRILSAFSDDWPNADIYDAYRVD